MESEPVIFYDEDPKCGQQFGALQNRPIIKNNDQPDVPILFEISPDLYNFRDSGSSIEPVCHTFNFVVLLS